MELSLLSWLGTVGAGSTLQSVILWASAPVLTGSHLWVHTQAEVCPASDLMHPNHPYEMSSETRCSVEKHHRSTARDPQKGVKIGDKGHGENIVDCGQ